MRNEKWEMGNEKESHPSFERQDPNMIFLIIRSFE